jgi:pimeloyl-ACP methyl ester carboxylesterase
MWLLPLLTSVALGDTTGFTPSGVWFRSTGSGTPVVLVHGSNLDSRTWGPVREVLRSTYRVVELDLRYHGQTRDGSGPFSFVGDVIEVLDVLGIPRAWVVGHSLGATIAVDLALDAPGRVAGLALLGPAISGLPPTRQPEGFGPVIAAVRARDMEAAAAAIARTPVMSLMADTMQAALVRVVLRDNVRLFLADPGRVRPPASPANGRLQALDVPVLVITGSRDPTEADRSAGALEAAAPRVRRVTLPGCGHLMLLDCVPETARALRDFLPTSRGGR